MLLICNQNHLIKQCATIFKCGGTRQLECKCTFPGKCSLDFACLLDNMKTFLKPISIRLTFLCE